MTPTERALNAKLVIGNQAFLDAFQSLEWDLMASWKATSPDQWKDRERLYDQLRALQDVKHKLETFIHTAALDSTAIR